MLRFNFKESVVMFGMIGIALGVLYFALPLMDGRLAR
jgi:hypothetical protein